MSIVNTLNKNIITREVYYTYVSIYYYECRVELFNLQFKTFFKHLLKEIDRAMVQDGYTENLVSHLPPRATRRK